jgi:Ca-activated chloride channel family protein
LTTIDKETEPMPRNHAPRTSRPDERARRSALRCFAVVLFAVHLTSDPRAANAFTHWTDANLITAIDVSDSIGRHEEWIQQTGIARALVNRDFLEAVDAGRHGRIGFAVFAWSSDGRFDLLVPWTVIASAEDARRIAATIQSATLIDRSHYGGGDPEEDDEPIARQGRRTDISASIDFGSRLLTVAPFATERSVMNILANGADNVGDGAEPARDRAVARGQTINGVILGRQPDSLADSFRSSVIGGRGAFVMELSDPDKASEIMAQKFRLDLVARF